jgi:hypothetical protein
MTPVPYYDHPNRNSGRIKSVGESTLVASINPGHGGGDMELPANCTWTGKHNRWERVEPRVDARVWLCVDASGEVEGFILLQDLSGHEFWAGTRGGNCAGPG